MNILILGSGGREHCLAWKVSQNRKVKKIFVAPGNAGIAGIANCVDIPTDKDNFPALLEFINNNKIDFTIVGPEAPLVDGITDYLEKNGHAVFGPSENAARIEGSKVFTKKFAERNNIPGAKAYFFKKNEYEKAKAFIENLDADSYPWVIKADGLASGKGVIICKNKDEMIKALRGFFIEDLFGKSGEEIVIEEFIAGFEVSVMCLCDGKSIIPMEFAQDYKRIFDDDKGKNTGGMGSFSPVPFVDESLRRKILDKIIFPTFDSLKKEGIVYKGILYGGIIIKNNEPYLLEYNCRFGDPETQVVLPGLKNDLLEILMNAASGNLDGTELEWSGEKCICVVIASKGYPDTSSRGDVIHGISKHSNKDDILVFHAGTRMENGNIVTNGGRVLNIVSKDITFKGAIEKNYNKIKSINFDGMQFRNDIARKVAEK
jgi:phosphoribosylamine--glycine ligase